MTLCRDRGTVSNVSTHRLRGAFLVHRLLDVLEETPLELVSARGFLHLAHLSIAVVILELPLRLREARHAVPPLVVHGLADFKQTPEVACVYVGVERDLIVHPHLVRGCAPRSARAKNVIDRVQPPSMKFTRAQNPKGTRGENCVAAFATRAEAGSRACGHGSALVRRQRGPADGSAGGNRDGRGAVAARRHRVL